MYQLMTLERPLQYQPGQAFNPVLTDPVRAFYPQRLQDLVLACIQTVPHERITAKELWLAIHDQVASYQGLRK